MLRPVSSPDDTVGLVHAMMVCSFPDHRIIRWVYCSVSGAALLELAALHCRLRHAWQGLRLH
jgi:hypothetical protein